MRLIYKYMKGKLKNVIGVAIRIVANHQGHRRYKTIDKISGRTVAASKFRI